MDHRVTESDMTEATKHACAEHLLCSVICGGNIAEDKPGGILAGIELTLDYFK